MPIEKGFANNPKELKLLYNGIEPLGKFKDIKLSEPPQFIIDHRDEIKEFWEEYKKSNPEAFNGLNYGSFGIEDQKLVVFPSDYATLLFLRHIHKGVRKKSEFGIPEDEEVPKFYVVGVCGITHYKNEDSDEEMFILGRKGIENVAKDLIELVPQE